MLPRLDRITPTQSRYLAFMESLKRAGFRGELSPDYATRTVLATDNSIYQVLPQAIVFPRDRQDLQCLTALAGKADWSDIVLSPRGGGTGTNGQSLSDGIVVDLSRHMNRILEINPEERWARVEAGVVKDQLNAAVRSHGLFFAPELSTSNRATIGGMINTDASGQGSVMYGKTRDHVLDLVTVLIDGSVLHSHPLLPEDEAAALNASGRTGEIYRKLADIWDRRREDIQARFPKLNRCLTGYDLAHIRDDDGRLNANSVLCGSEGTLGFVAEARINLEPIPEFQALIVVQYDSFDASLRDARTLMQARPASIETVDNRVLDMARTDIVWEGVAPLFSTSDGHVAGVNLVEYTAASEQELEDGIARLTRILDAPEHTGSRTYSIARGETPVNRIWAMRKRAVGLLGKTAGEARPIAFVEDTVVPPEHLADFIMEFRALLDREQLNYGMFGHVDAGVLHVRPALDLKQPETIKRVRRVTEEVVKLVRQYGGLLWGEHGKGFRSEFAPDFFGDLYPELQAVKRTFDPHNQLNPGKIATTSARIPLTRLDEPGLRGQLDRTIPAKSRAHQQDAMNCNGNGACYNYDPDDAMCPSWKGTRDRRHSPKGRASLMREWLRLLGEHDIDTEQLAHQTEADTGLRTAFRKAVNTFHRARGDYDFSNEVFDSMAGCLSCKSCASQCPVQVDVPEFRTRFLQLYYGRYLRPVKDHFIGRLEQMLPWIANPLIRPIYNHLMRLGLIRSLLRRTGMVDSPLLSTRSPVTAARDLGIDLANEKTLMALSDKDRERAVIIVQDAFTSYFETDTFSAILQCLKKLGFSVWLLPYHANGKPLHVHGFLRRFRTVADSHTRLLTRFGRFGIPLVGIDPSMTLAYRSEYRKYANARVPWVSLLQEFLSEQRAFLESRASIFTAGEVSLLGHCSEKTNAMGSMTQWQTVFEALGQKLTIEASGCCGMAGTYGHETRNRETSATIYDLSWRGKMDSLGAANVVATGYSCRSQVKRIQQERIRHPMEYLLERVNDGAVT